MAANDYECESIGRSFVLLVWLGRYRKKFQNNSTISNPNSHSSPTILLLFTSISALNNQSTLSLFFFFLLLILHPTKTTKEQWVSKILKLVYGLLCDTRIRGRRIISSKRTLLRLWPLGFSKSTPLFLLSIVLLILLAPPKTPWNYATNCQLFFPLFTYLRLSCCLYFIFSFLVGRQFQFFWSISFPFFFGVISWG